MKWIEYQVLQCKAGEMDILIDKKVGYSEANLAIAEREAHDGYVITEDDQSFPTDVIGIFNGFGAAEGAGLWLYNNNHSNKGRFRLQVYDKDNSKYKAFDGLPNGDLLWDGGYINTNMTIGVEYKMCERHNGSQVYAKLLNGGALPNNASKTINAGLTPNKVISIEAMVTDGTYSLKLPYIFATGEIRAIVYNKNGNITITTMADLSAYTATILVKYIK